MKQILTIIVALWAFIMPFTGSAQNSEHYWGSYALYTQHRWEQIDPNAPNIRLCTMLLNSCPSASSLRAKWLAADCQVQRLNKETESLLVQSASLRFNNDIAVIFSSAKHLYYVGVRAYALHNIDEAAKNLQKAHEVLVKLQKKELSKDQKAAVDKLVVNYNSLCGQYKGSLYTISDQVAKLKLIRQQQEEQQNKKK